MCVGVGGGDSHTHRLLGQHALAASLGQPLAARQVDEVHLGVDGGAVALHPAAAADVQREDAVRPAHSKRQGRGMNKEVPTVATAVVKTASAQMRRVQWGEINWF